MAPRASIRKRLGAATCALVGLTAPIPIEATEVETSALVYAELNRVNAYEALFRGRRAFANGRLLTATVTVDVLTGASPNGATPSTRPQTFTRPSGDGRYITPPGQTPLDDTFQDNRLSIALDYGAQFGRMTRANLGGYASREYDYASLSVNGGVTRDFNRRNTTITLNGAYGHDALSPEGGPPIPYAPMRPAGTPPLRQENNKTRTVADGLVGITQILSRNLLVQLNYSVTYLDGYLIDPFKIVSVVDGNPGPDQGEPVEYIYEKRPEQRTKQSVYGLLKAGFAGAVLDLSYRYMQDDWGVHSNTAEFKYMVPIGRRVQLQPQLRYYHQTGADFFVYSLIDGEPLPAFATADVRMGEFTALTFALRWAALLKNRHRINLRLGYYRQMGDSSPPDAIGVQKQLNLFPTLEAVIAQLGYSFSF